MIHTKKQFNFASPIYNENDCIESSFSWSKCECCNDTQGGDRYMIKYRDINDDIDEASVCTECFLKLCS